MIHGAERTSQCGAAVPGVALNPEKALEQRGRMPGMVWGENMSAVLDIWGVLGGHSVHSNLLSYSWGEYDSPFGRYSPHVAMNQFAVTRRPDKYSRLLFQLCAAGSPIDVLKVTLTYTDEDGYPAKGGLIFNDSAVSSIRVSGRANSVEQMSIRYGSFTQEY